MLPFGARSLWKERAIVLAVIAALVLGCWSYLFAMRAGMGDAHAWLAMPMGARWSLSDWAAMAFMWVVMMIGMMLPAASPMILAYRHFDAGPRSTPAFTGGYLLAWSLFSLGSTALQWGLHDVGVIDWMGAAASPVTAAGLLIVAGAFQFTRFKEACLTQCRSPLAFLMTQWRPGTRGALTMGLRHGLSCIGCCWALMLLMFAFGVMNLAWMVGLAAFMLVEKAFPAARLTTRLAGAVAMVWGLLLLVPGLLG